MEQKEPPEEFPDVTHKLAAPKKLSQFEKDRQAQQAKQQRAEAENAAALAAFRDSFEGDDDEDSLSGVTSGRGPPPNGPRGSSMGFGGSRGRHGMINAAPRSGPGSLGPIPGPPPPSLKRKRALDEMREAHEARREQEDLIGYDGSRGHTSNITQSGTMVDDRELDAPRPTVHLSSLPPNTSSDEVKAMLRDYLKVQSVRFLPPAAPGVDTKRSLSAIATLSSDVLTSQIDTAVSALKDKYIGYGFYLSISRHLSSAAMHPTMTPSVNTRSTEPFGAEKPRERERFSMRNAPPPIDQRGFAPPDSYHSSTRNGYGPRSEPEATVSVQPPLDIESIKAVHTVVGALLLESNPARVLQTEAMLMSLDEVQRDERFAFLFDSRSPAGVYYRYLLWSPEGEDESIKEMKRRDQAVERIYGDMPISWIPPYLQVPFPDLKSLEQVVTEIDYVSSDEESDDEGGERHFNSGRDGEIGLDPRVEKKHLTPLQRARFVHQLSRLPTSNARLRKGDVARITNFAISHAGQGAEEIVDLLLLNVEKPLSYSLASKYEESEDEQDEEDLYEPDDDLTVLHSPAPPKQRDNKRDDDPSNSKMIAIYIISDILSASSTAGAKNAWKYRQLFEAGFRAQKTFEHLGKLDKDLAWGRLKTEQWKRKVGVIFGIWEGWSVFSSEVHEELKQSFFEPPLSEEEKAAAQVEAEREEKKKQEEKWVGKFKRVGGADSPAASASPAPTPAVVAEKGPDDFDGVLLDDVDGAPMDDEVSGMPLDGDMDGAPIGGLDGAADERPVASRIEGKVRLETSATRTNEKLPGPRRRMRAEDMFADSDDE